MRKEEYTLQSFIESFLSSNKEDRGYICIVQDDCPWHNYPKFEYRRGQIIKEPGYLAEEVYNYKVESVLKNTSGSLVNYDVKLKKED